MPRNSSSDSEKGSTPPRKGPAEPVVGMLTMASHNIYIESGTKETMGYEHPKRYAESNPGRPTVIVGDTGVTLSYGDMESRSNRLANVFRSLGLGVGDHVAILMENRTEYFEAVWAGIRAGLFVTPINWHLAPDEVEYIVRDSAASVLVTSSFCAALAKGVDGRRERSLRGRRACRGFRPLRACAGSPPAVPDRRRVRGHLDVLLLRDDRAPEGH